MRNVCTLALLAAGMAACGAHPAVISGPGGTSQQIERVRNQETMGTENQLIVEGRNRGNVRLLSAREERPNGFLRLYMGFQNTSNSDQSIQYEVHFFDATGLPITETSGWVPLEIAAKSAGYATVTSVRREAATFKVHMSYR